MRRPLTVSIHLEDWLMRAPFRITGRTEESNTCIVVELSDGKHAGRGEGLPVHYLGETPQSLYQQVDAVAGEIERGVDRKTLPALMQPGGARNAVDSALWDLEAKRSGKSIWNLTGLHPLPQTTVFTIGIEDTPEAMAARAREAAQYPILKVKVNQDRPAERVAAIRAARPDARLTVDANQGWTFEQLVEVTPQLAELGVEMIEQPLPRGRDDALEGFCSAVPLCADESCQHRGELESVARRYQVINIKLDKVGGLTEALLHAQAVKSKNLESLVGCMGGTSLSMAPAFVLAQLCKYVELDGPLLLKRDRVPGLSFENAVICGLDARLWG